MPGSEDTIRILDSSLEKSEVQAILAALIPLEEKIKTFSGVSLFTKNTTGASEFRQQSQLIIDMQTKMKAMEEQLDSIRAGNHRAQKVRTDDEIRETEKLRIANKTRVDNIKAEGSAYQQLALQYREAAAQAKNLAVQYGSTSNQAIAAAKHANELGNRLKSIDASVGQHTRNVGEYGKAWEKFGISFKGLGPFFGSIKESISGFAEQFIIAGAAFKVFEGTIDFVKDSVKEFESAEQATAKFNNILKNLGREDAIEGLNKEAEKLSEQFGIIAKKDVTNIFQKLITQGKLTENQIKELTPVIINFAAKTGQSFDDSASIIIKSLEGNNRGLKEFGINIKDGHDAVERFGIIMDQLKPRVDGAADAFGTTLAGSIKKTDVAIEELKVQIGEEFAPALKKGEAALLSFVKNIPDIVDKINDKFDSFILKIKEAGAGFLYLASFGKINAFKGLVEEAEAKERELETAKEQRSLDQVHEEAADRVIKKGAAATKEEIAAQKDLLQAQIKKQELAKAGGQTFGVGLLIRDQDIKNTKDYLKLLEEGLKGLQDKRILGFGADDKKKTGNDDEMERQLQREIDYWKKLADEVNNTNASRVHAYKMIEELEAKQHVSEDERMAARVEQIGRLAKIKYDSAHLDVELAAANNKEIEAMEVLHLKAMADLAKLALANQKAYLEDAANAEHSANDKDFLSGKIDAKTHAKNKAGIDYNASKALLTDASTNADKLLSANPNDASLQEQASRARMNLYDLEVQHKMEKEANLAAQKKHFSDLEMQAAQEVGNTIKAFVEGSYERQLNAIQKQIDKNNELKEKETQSIATSTLSLQEKASAQILLDAKVNASNEALQRRQRDIKIKEAQFDRAAAILQITEQAAIAAVSALKIPIYGEAEAIAIGVIAAAQIASILAKHIPTYKIGGTQKEDGPMIVHPGEMRVDPDGKVSMTPNAPATLTYGKKGTKIIPADEVNRMMLSDMMKMTVREYDNRKDLQEIKEAIQEGTMAQIRAMGKKQPIHIHNHFNPGFNDHINAAVRN